MIPILPLLGNVLLKYWQPIALVVLGAAAIGYYNYKLHQAYNEGEKAGLAVAATWETKYKDCLSKYAADVQEWEARVQRVHDENVKEIDRRNKIIEFLNVKYSEKELELLQKQTGTRNEIKATIKVTDVVTAPANFHRLYNDAVYRSGSMPTFVGSGNPEGVQASSAELIGKSVTFDAVAFSEVVIGNVDKYNELALRCNALIDIVKEIQDGATVRGVEGKISKIGGDLPTGIVASYQ